MSIGRLHPGIRMPVRTTSKNESGRRSVTGRPIAPLIARRAADALRGGGTRLANARTPGVVIARKNGSAFMPGSATAGMPSATTLVTRSGCASARFIAHIAPSEVPATGTRSSSSASSNETSCATACRRSGRSE